MYELRGPLGSSWHRMASGRHGGVFGCQWAGYSALAERCVCLGPFLFRLRDSAKDTFSFTRQQVLDRAGRTMLETPKRTKQHLKREAVISMLGCDK